MRFLRTKDNLERVLMQAIATKAFEIERELVLYRAQIQANEIARLFK